MNNIKSIGELVTEPLPFLVEDYQRGYKWTKAEVEQLLNDINEFNGEGFYCLQPIVIKKTSDNGVEKIELIDGQQRITTIYIILSVLDKEKFHIEYRTRTSSADFLECINSIAETEYWNIYIKTQGHEKDNIDNFHFFKAYHTIKKWFKEKGDKESFFNKLQDRVKVIWYEVPFSNLSLQDSKEESIKIFIRINSGKIPLTNAELIKALFLINVDKGPDKEKLKLKQNEIAQQWDSFEYALQDNAFWYFLSNAEPPATRIDLIFDLIAKKPENDEEKLFTFLKYNDGFIKADKSKWVKDEWDKVKTTFLTLQEWYEDRELYHLIGFLISSKISSIAELYGEYEKLKKEITKIKWLCIIKDKIKERVKDYKLDELSFEEDKDKGKINKVLLLYNIQTELNNKNSNSKYQFNKHKELKWSLEHIHAQKQGNLNGKEEILKYVCGFINYLKAANLPDQIEKIKKLESKCIVGIAKNSNIENKPFKELKELFDDFLQEATDTFPKLFGLHELDNMALLPVSINSSLGNDFFDEKRKRIIDFDKEGQFIPICTRNVFLKYYSSDQKTNLFYWSAEDRQDYLENIKCTLKYYIPYTCKESETR